MMREIIQHAQHLRALLHSLNKVVTKVLPTIQLIKPKFNTASKINPTSSKYFMECPNIKKCMHICIICIFHHVNIIQMFA